MNFPEDFIFGFGTSSYQIEGATEEDGREPSIWDTFCARPGTIQDGSSGRHACDHYHRYREDAALLQSLSADAYCFSIAWPRVMKGNRINPAGFDFYSRLVDELLSRGIRPFAKLYHWDLPESLQSQGGWVSRDTSLRFADYTDQVTRVLGDRVKDWISHNEPWCAAFLGMYLGLFAPGYGTLSETLSAAHHILLSHGLAADPVRSNVTGAAYGIGPNYIPVYPASDTEGDRSAATRFDGYFNRWFFDPVFGKGYPADMVEYYKKDMPDIRDGDMERIAVPLDFLGVNYYNALVVADDPGGPLPEARSVPMEGVEKTADREIYPRGLFDTLDTIHKTYKPKNIYITENGAAFDDSEPVDGVVDDRGRRAFLRDHLAVASEALATGIPVKGFFVWSLLDNFEWASGYTLRYGVVHVNFSDQTRTVKNSGYMLRDIFRSHRLETS
ncbi:MAG: beta-glucosidase [Spirochaetales bacterium]|nr:beta-glucosidase [Spirochaetales bacterium]